MLGQEQVELLANKMPPSKKMIRGSIIFINNSIHYSRRLYTLFFIIVLESRPIFSSVRAMNGRYFQH